MAANIDYRVPQSGTLVALATTEVSAGVHIQKVTMADSTGNLAGVDADTKGLYTIDVAHARLHAGKSFTANMTGTLGVAGVLDVLLITPTTAECHFTLEFISNGEYKGELYEAATTSANGSAVAVYNRNRNSATTSTMAVYTGPTVTATGTTLIYQMLIGSGKTSGTERSSSEFEMKTGGTKYLLRLTSAVASNNYCLLLNWHEV